MSLAVKTIAQLIDQLCCCPALLMFFSHCSSPTALLRFDFRRLRSLVDQTHQRCVHRQSKHSAAISSFCRQLSNPFLIRFRTIFHQNNAKGNKSENAVVNRSNVHGARRISASSVTFGTFVCFLVTFAFKIDFHTPIRSFSQSRASFVVGNVVGC